MARYIDSLGLPPRILTLEEQNAVLNVSGDKAKTFRDHAIISLMLGTGLREHEVEALNVGDAFSPNGRLKNRIILDVFKGHKKTTLKQEVSLNPKKLRPKLNRLFYRKKKLGESLKPSAPLFMSRNSGRLATKTMRTMFKKWQDIAEIDTPITLHGLRHCAINNHFQEGKDIEATRIFARHSSIAITMRYLHASPEEKRRILQNLPC